MEDPISYPKIEIGGDTVEVKFRAGDIIRLKKLGVDIGNLEAVRGADAIERASKLIAAGISHAKGVKNSDQLEALANEIADELDLPAFKAAGDAVNESLKKAFPQAVNGSAPADNPPIVQ